MSRDMKEAFDVADFSRILRLMDYHFGESNYSLKSIFRDEQRKVLNQILSSTREEVYKSFRLISDRFMPLLRFLGDVGTAAPPALQTATHFVFNADLRHQFESPRLDPERVRGLLAECGRDGVPLEKDALAYALKGYLDRLGVEFEANPSDLETLRHFATAAENLWKTQNIYFRMTGTTHKEMRAKAGKGDTLARDWIEHFRALGESLGFETETLQS
jgi:hypothetical protein